MTSRFAARSSLGCHRARRRPLLAHHSFAVEYDPIKPVEGTGIISKVEWTNPHMRVYVDVTERERQRDNLESGAGQP